TTVRTWRIIVASRLRRKWTRGSRASRAFSWTGYALGHSMTRQIFVASSRRVRMPTREQVRRAIKAIKRYADYEYFFNELRSPDWIGPLLQEGMFKKPPGPIREGSFIRFPLWPESRYLARVAAKTPELVLKVIRQIPETENVRVHEDFIDAALLMPPALAGKLVDRATRWLNSPYELLLPHK